MTPNQLQRARDIKAAHDAIDWTAGNARDESDRIDGRAMELVEEIVEGQSDQGMSK